MIVVKIELWPLGDESRSQEIGRMEIANDATKTYKTGGNRGDYAVSLMRRGTIDKVQRVGRVEDHARNSITVWNLIHKAIKSVYPDWK